MGLEARGKSGNFGAIYEVIPAFEGILTQYKQMCTTYGDVNFNTASAPEDHLYINLRAAWEKLNYYYGKLDDSPVYYAAVCLHPFYKNYCQNSWETDHPDWLTSNEAALFTLWGNTKPTPKTPPQVAKASGRSSIREAIAALATRGNYPIEDNNLDQLAAWRKHEPQWTEEQYANSGHPIAYWRGISRRYPELADFAISILSIPASSCACERMFSELGDLLQPRRRNIGSEMLSAMQCTRSWRGAGLQLPDDSSTSYTGVERSIIDDEAIASMYNIDKWDYEDEVV